MTIGNYIEGLRRMDWEYDFSDDFRVYTNGREELAALKKLREIYDPSGEIWNQYAPAALKFTPPVVPAPDHHAADLAVSRSMASYTEADDRQPWRIS